MIEAYLGRVGLSAAIVVIAIVAAYSYYYHDKRHAKHDLQVQIIKVCADKPDLQGCAVRLTKTINGVR